MSESIRDVVFAVLDHDSASLDRLVGLGVHREPFIDSGTSIELTALDIAAIANAAWAMPLLTRDGPWPEQALDASLRWGTVVASSAAVNAAIQHGASALRMAAEGLELVPIACGAIRRDPLLQLFRIILGVPSDDVNLGDADRPADEDDIVATLGLLLAAGADIDAETKEGTGLEIAVNRGFVNVTTSLLNHGATVDQAMPLDQRLMVAAAREGRLRAVMTLAARGVDIDAADQEGRYPLLEAAREQHFEVVDKLLELGANPEVSSFGGVTLVHLLVRSNQTERIEALANRDVAIDTPNVLGHTPLWEAVTSGLLEMSRILLAAGAAPDHREGDGNPILHGLAIRLTDADSLGARGVRMAAAELTRLLVLAGASLTTTGADGLSLPERLAQSTAPEASLAMLEVVLAADYPNKDHIGAALREASEGSATIGIVRRLLASAPPPDTIADALSKAVFRLSVSSAADQARRTTRLGIIDLLLATSPGRAVATHLFDHAFKNADHELLSRLLNAGGELLGYLRSSPDSTQRAFYRAAEKPMFAKAVMAELLRRQLLDMPSGGAQAATRERQTFDEHFAYRMPQATISLRHPGIEPPTDLRRNPDGDQWRKYSFREGVSNRQYSFQIHHEPMTLPDILGGGTLWSELDIVAAIAATERAPRELCYAKLTVRSVSSKGRDIAVTQNGQALAPIRAGDPPRTFDRSRGPMTFSLAIPRSSSEYFVAWTFDYNEGPDATVPPDFDDESVRMSVYLRLADLVDRLQGSSSDSLASRADAAAIRAITGGLVARGYLRHVLDKLRVAKREVVAIYPELTALRGFLIEHDELTIDVLPGLQDLADTLRGSHGELAQLVEEILRANQSAIRASRYLALFRNEIVARAVRWIGEYQLRALEVAQYLSDSELLAALPMTTNEHTHMAKTILATEERIDRQDLAGRGATLRRHFLGRD